MKKQLAFIVSNSGTITVNIDGRHHSIAPDFVTYTKVKESLKTRDIDKLEHYLDIGKAITKAGGGRVVMLDGEVYHDGNVLHNSLSKRIIALMKEGFPFEPMTKFLENLMNNPSKTAVDELYLFLEANNLPITEDGCFLAYKRVDDNYNSYHKNRDGSDTNHVIGKTVEMQRGEVTADRSVCNSDGLHFCGISYLSHYNSGRGKIVVLKINPANVVSIPKDYGNAKGRCCQYEVIAEHFDGESNDTVSKSPLYIGLAKTETKPARDSKGRFIKRA